MSSPIETSNRNLDYQFYFLFRTFYYWEGAELVREPFIGFDTLQENGIQIDTDKRLFRRNAQAQTPLTEWQTELQAAWREIYAKYHRVFEGRDSRNYCENALLGVALLIMDESLERHNETIKLDFYDGQQEKKGEMCFKYIPQLENWLLSIRDKENIMPVPARLYAFVPHSTAHFWQVNNWTLRFDRDVPYLSQITPDKLLGIPTFAVYGMAHGDADTVLKNADTALKREQTWPIKFQNVFCSSVEHGIALLNSVMARLIIRDSIFAMMDCPAQSVRTRLKEKKILYTEQSDKDLKSTPNHILQERLREIDTLKAETNYVRGDLEKGIETLNINYENLQWRLAQSMLEQQAWVIDYQGMVKEPPLLSSISLKRDNLKSHIAYIQGELFHLEGSWARWRSFISEQSHSLTGTLVHVAHIIIFLVALAEMGEVVEKPTGQLNSLDTFVYWFLTWLHKPDLYVILLILLVVYLIGYYGYKLLKVISYYKKRYGCKWCKVISYRIKQFIKTRGKKHG